MVSPEQPLKGPSICLFLHSLTQASVVQPHCLSVLYFEKNKENAAVNKIISIYRGIKLCECVT